MVFTKINANSVVSDTGVRISLENIFVMIYSQGVVSVAIDTEFANDDVPAMIVYLSGVKTWDNDGLVSDGQRNEILDNISAAAVAFGGRFIFSSSLGCQARPVQTVHPPLRT